jgi:5-methylcytosine-specific restriction endonuclease McrA
MDFDSPRYRLATAARISATEKHTEEHFVAMIGSCSLGREDFDFAMERFRHYKSQPSAQGPKYRPFNRCHPPNKGTRLKNKSTRHRHYVRAGTLSIEETFERMKDKAGFQKVFGVKADFHSWRLICYESKGVTCVKCGLTGNLFAVERGWAENTDKYHLNLYHFGANGYERMMTVDHIVPKSKGGQNDINNLQPMCSSCNMKKSDKCEPETAV